MFRTKESLTFRVFCRCGVWVPEGLVCKETVGWWDNRALSREVPESRQKRMRRGWQTHAWVLENVQAGGWSGIWGFWEWEHLILNSKSFEMFSCTFLPESFGKIFSLHSLAVVFWGIDGLGCLLGGVIWCRKKKMSGIFAVSTFAA